MRFPVGICLALAAGFLQAALCAGESGEIGCAAPFMDFGRKDNREDIVHTFVLRNKGSGTVKIKHIEAPCGCTITSLPRQQIDPGGTLDLTVTFRLAGRSGPQEKSVYVDSDARNKPRLELVMKGYAISRVTMNPPSVFFGRVPAGKEGADTVEIITGHGITFDVKSVTSDSKAFTPSFEVVKPGNAYKLKVVMAPQAKAGLLTGTIDVATTSKEYPVLHIPVSGHVVGELSVFPLELVLDRGAAPATKSVFVTAGQVTKFKIVDVQAPFVKTPPRVMPFGEDGFRILLRDVAATPDVEGQEIRITTDAPTMKDIRIPVRIGPPPVSEHAGGKDGR